MHGSLAGHPACLLQVLTHDGRHALALVQSVWLRQPTLGGLSAGLLLPASLGFLGLRFYCGTGCSSAWPMATQYVAQEKQGCHYGYPVHGLGDDAVSEDSFKIKQECHCGITQSPNSQHIYPEVRCTGPLFSSL